MSHPCRNFWHEDAAILVEKLATVPFGSGAVMAYTTYGSLVLAMRRIEAAIVVPPGNPKPWLREVLDDPYLAAATASFVNYLGTDEVDTTQGNPGERHTPGTPQWLQNTGSPEPGAVDQLRDLHGRIKTALGG